MAAIKRDPKVHRSYQSGHVGARAQIGAAMEPRNASCASNDSSCM
jgi:hypothetical protein